MPIALGFVTAVKTLKIPKAFSVLITAQVLLGFGPSQENRTRSAIIVAWPSLSSSLLKALALGQQEWFIQLCKGKNAVPSQQVE